MENRCINHPEKERLIIVREWQIEFCDGNICAAALLSFFEYWHNIKLDLRANVKDNHDLAEDEDRNLWQFHTAEKLAEGIMLYRRSSIAKGILILKRKGVIEVGRNPNPRYRFDRTRHFLFKPEVANAFLQARCIVNNTPSTENSSRQTEKDRTIPETTPEVTNETTKKEAPPTPPPKAMANQRHRRGIANLLKKILGKNHSAFGDGDGDGGFELDLFEELMSEDPERTAWLDLPYSRVREIIKDATNKGREQGIFKRLLIRFLDEEVIPE